jgi:GT2 family glycosyltransferase
VSLVTAVIPVHNRADLLERLLDTMRAQTAAFTETIVVDNASDDSAAHIARVAGCRVIQMDENAGFARAVNRGWRAARTEWVAVLNSDVELEPRWLEHLLASAGESAFATGSIFDGEHRDLLDGTYDLVGRAGCPWRAGHSMPASAAGSPVTISIAPATACLIRRKVLEQLGGFEESFDSYLEDVDFGLRCVVTGLSGIYVPQAKAWHRGSATWGRWSPRVVRLIARNQLLLISRHFDPALFRRWLWPIMVGQMLWGLIALRHGAGLAWLAGKREGFRGFRLRGRPSADLNRFLLASEREIQARAPGAYWKWYFRIAGRIDT